MKVGGCKWEGADVREGGHKRGGGGARGWGCERECEGGQEGL